MIHKLEHCPAPFLPDCLMMILVWSPGSFAIFN